MNPTESPSRARASAARRRAEAAPTPPERAVVDEAIGNLFARTRRLFWTEAQRHLEAGGESPTTMRLLEHLVRSGAAAQCDVAIALGQHPAYVSRAIDELEAGGLARRRRDAVDRRKVVVEVTARGRARWRASAELMAAAREAFLAPLSGPERRTLCRLLDKLVVAAEGAEAPPARAPKVTSRG
jgi:DNA-binding MarR family transcriptional regulator